MVRKSKAISFFYLFLLFCRIKDYLCLNLHENEDMGDLPSNFNLLYFNKKDIAISYKKLLIEVVYNISKLTDDTISIKLCNDTINSIQNENLLYNMFLASGYYSLSGSTNLADSSLCEELSVNDLTLKILIREKNNTNNKLKTQINNSFCFPDQCRNLINSIDSDYMFMEDNGNFDQENLLFAFSIIFLVFILIFIVINILGCFFISYNPYDINNPETEDENFLLENENAYNMNEESYPRRNKLLNLFYTYFSLPNLFYLITTTKNKVYNENKLKFVNGILVLFCILHIISSIYKLLRNISKNFDEYYLMEFIYYFNSLGSAYMDIFVTILGFVFTFKYLNFIKFFDQHKTQKLIILMLRQLDKIIIILFFNYIWNYIIDKGIYNFSHNSWILYLFNKELKSCTFGHFIPVFEIFELFPDSKEAFYNNIKCNNTNIFFIITFWMFLCLCILLSISSKIKGKFKLFFGLFTIFVTLRITFIILSLEKYENGSINDGTPGKELMYYLTIFYDKYIHSQFYYLIPNLIFGIIGGYVHYLNYNHEIILNEGYYDYYKGIDKIRIYLEERNTRSVLFLVSIIFLFGFGGSSHWINNSLGPKSMTLYVLVSIKGILVSFGIVLLILTVKIKGDECWNFVEIFLTLLKKIFNNEGFLFFGRSIFIVNLIHLVITYLVIVNLEQIYISLDFFNIIIMYGLPLMIITIFISFIITIIFELPLKIVFKKIFKIKKN